MSVPSHAPARSSLSAAALVAALLVAVALAVVAVLLFAKTSDLSDKLASARTQQREQATQLQQVRTMLSTVEKDDSSSKVKALVKQSEAVKECLPEMMTFVNSAEWDEDGGYISYSQQVSSHCSKLLYGYSADGGE